jgi:hypothetical protein
MKEAGAGDRSDDREWRPVAVKCYRFVALASGRSERVAVVEAPLRRGARLRLAIGKNGYVIRSLLPARH